jgi:uncharacterized protein with HEPN domain
MRDDRAYLEHILECIARVGENTTEGKHAFMNSHTLQDAVLRNMQILTESTQRLSESVKSAHPEIEWRRLAAFRNILVHEYLGVDLEIVWQIVERDLPTLEAAVREALAGLS